MTDARTMAEVVGDAVAAHRRTEPLDHEDERELARSLATEEVGRLADRALAGGGDPLSEAEERRLVREVLDHLYGAFGIQSHLDDDTVSDIHINGADNVWIKRRDGRRERVAPVAASDEELIERVSAWARGHGRVEQRWDYASPTLNMRLPNGDRLHAVMSVSTRPSISIRRHDFTIVGLDDLERRGTVSATVAAFLRAAVRSRRNLVISGGTGSGKTTLLRCLANEIDTTERLVTIEDSLELGLSRFEGLHPDCVEMEGRRPNLEGRGEISMAHLVTEALRMDPDRVIVGEVRGAEVVPMLLAMSQGNDGSMCTIHAESSSAAFGRIQTYAATLSEARVEPHLANLLIRDAVHFVVHIGWVDGRRVVRSVREVDRSSGPGELASTEVFAPGPDGSAVPAYGLTSTDHIDALGDAGFTPALSMGI